MLRGYQKRRGTLAFSSTNYWTGSEYPMYVYDSNSYLFDYVNNYKMYLEELGAIILDARLINYQELTNLGCSISSGLCSSEYSWIYSTTYWTGFAHNESAVWRVSSTGKFVNGSYNVMYNSEIRPVIVISKLNF